MHANSSGMEYNSLRDNSRKTTTTKIVATSLSEIIGCQNNKTDHEWDEWGIIGEDPQGYEIILSQCKKCFRQKTETGGKYKKPVTF